MFSVCTISIRPGNFCAMLSFSTFLMKHTGQTFLSKFTINACEKAEIYSKVYCCKLPVACGNEKRDIEKLMICIGTETKNCGENIHYRQHSSINGGFRYCSIEWPFQNYNFLPTRNKRRRKGSSSIWLMVEGSNLVLCTCAFAGMLSRSRGDDGLYAHQRSSCLWYLSPTAGIKPAHISTYLDRQQSKLGRK